MSQGTGRSGRPSAESVPSTTSTVRTRRGRQPGQWRRVTRATIPASSVDVIPDRPRLTTGDTGVGAQKAPVNAAGAIHTTVRQVNRGPTRPQIPPPAAPDPPFPYAMDPRGGPAPVCAGPCAAPGRAP